MRSGLPPVHMDGPDHPHSFDNVPTRERPEHADVPCTTCRGHGAWNELLHLDSFRCRLATCHDCRGSGWVSRDGGTTTPDIVLTDGVPRWTLRRTPRPPMLVASRGRDACGPCALELEAA